MGHLKVVLMKVKFLSVEFSMTQKCRKVSVRLLEGQRLLYLGLLHTDRGYPTVKSQLAKVAQCLGAVSQALLIISCSWVSVDVVKALDSCQSREFGVPYP